MAAEKKIQFESAGEVIAKHAGETRTEEVTWPTRCAHGRMLIENAEGRIIRTDYFITAATDDKGAFDPEARNPLATHMTKNGAPIGEYSFWDCKFKGTTRASVVQGFSAFVANGNLDQFVPAKEKEPVSAENPLAAPSSDVNIPS